MMNLVERIDRAIEEKAMKTGAMGTENVSVELKLTDEEVVAFKEIEKYNDVHYFWSIEDENVLAITYTEEV